MPIKILMPALSPTMTEGTLTQWLKNEGDIVKAGEILAEIETDKATMEVEAVDEGILGKIVVPGGSEGVAVNTLIAILLEEGEDTTALDVIMHEAEAPAAITSPAPTPEPTPSAPSKIGSSTAETTTTVDQRIFASPLARRIAADQNISLQTLSGSGPRGRIIKADVEKAVAQASTTPQESTTFFPELALSADLTGESPYEDITLNGMRKTIAKRLTESKQTIPHFYLSVDCVLDNLLTLRQEMNGHLKDSGLKISVNDFVIRAVGLALRRVPEANAAWMDTHIRQFTRADVSVAVALEGGLVTPVVRGVEYKTVRQLSQEIKNLAERARAGQLLPHEYQGGGFTVSNLGMYGIKEFSAIINPPQACILAIGAGEKRAIVSEDQVKIATVMTCTLSADHRAVDGAVGARFLAAFKEYMEHPISLLY